MTFIRRADSVVAHPVGTRRIPASMRVGVDRMTDRDASTEGNVAMKKPVFAAVRGAVSASWQAAMNRVWNCALATVALGCAIGASQAATVTIRFNDYDGGAFADPAYGFVPNAGAAAAVPVQGLAGLGVGSNTFSGNMLRNAAPLGSQGTGGVFSNLPLGGALSFSFLFAALDSWDASDPTFGPDRFELLMDDVVVWSTTIGNFPPSSSNGGVLLGSGLLFSGSPEFPDSAWDFTNVPGLQDLPYAGTGVSYLFRASGAGWEGGSGESWAVDNFRVTLTPASAVPEPSTLALILTGAATLVAGRRGRIRRDHVNT